MAVSLTSVLTVYEVMVLGGKIQRKWIKSVALFLTVRTGK